MSHDIQSANDLRSPIVTAAGVTAAVTAHQGGWDEALLVAGPIMVIVGLLMLAKERVDAAAAAPETSDEAAPTP
jgi:hypothetical protein